MEHECGRFHILRVFERRPIPVQIELLEDVALKIVFVSVRAVTGPIVAYEVRDAAQRDGSLETSGWPEDPIGHEATVAAASDAQPIAIDPWIFRKDGIHAV